MGIGIALQATFPLRSVRAARHIKMPPADWLRSLLTAYSPRPNLNALQWCAKLIATTRSWLSAALPFGMHELFQQASAKDDDILRFGLMDKRTAQTREPNRTNDLAAIHAITARKNVVLAVGNNIVTNEFDRWLAELDQIVARVFVHWVHTKYMIVDPLRENPIIVSGSANFSDASTKDNDENVLVIRGDKRVADIYLGEFMACIRTTRSGKRRRSMWNRVAIRPTEAAILAGF